MIDDILNIHIGEGFDAVAKRVADSWHRAETGENVKENHISFVSWDLLTKVMTGRRYELLCYLHNHPEKTVASLARAVSRDYKHVYNDVSLLESAGLISREGGMLHTDYDRINSTIELPKA